MRGTAGWASATGFDRWLGLGNRICLATNSWRQNVELAVLILAQAVVEVESRGLLFLIALSLLPVASYSIAQSTGVFWNVDFLVPRFDSYRQHCFHHSSSEPNARTLKEAGG